MLFELHDRHLTHAIFYKNIVIIQLLKQNRMRKKGECVFLKEIDELIGDSNVKNDVIALVRDSYLECVVEILFPTRHRLHARIKLLHSRKNGLEWCLMRLIWLTRECYFKERHRENFPERCSFIKVSDFFLVSYYSHKCTMHFVSEECITCTFEYRHRVSDTVFLSYAQNLLDFIGSNFN